MNLSASAGSANFTGWVRPSAEELARDLPGIAADLGSRYDVLGYLGRGGFASVWHAEDQGRPVAVKRFFSTAAKPRGFYHELSVLFRLQHPGIVRIVNLLEAESGARYLVLEYCAGGTLRAAFSRARREGKRLPLPHALGLARRLGEALAFAHGQGIVHRDIKPENILFGAEPADWGVSPLPRVKIADFGLARMLGGPERASALAGLSGSPAYMSPEQFAGGWSTASDLYALGVVLFEAMTGDIPFSGSPEELARAHLRDQPPLDALPAGAVRYLAPLLAKQPADRPELAEWLASLPDPRPEPLRMSRLSREDENALDAEITKVESAVSTLGALRRGQKLRVSDRHLLRQYGFDHGGGLPAMEEAMDWGQARMSGPQEEPPAIVLGDARDEPEPAPRRSVLEESATGGGSVDSVLGMFDWR